MKSRYFILLIVCLIAVTGCGRKLPPSPPVAAPPLAFSSLRFEGGEVIIKIKCNVDNGTVVLLGKPRGRCPSCMDDLNEKDAVTIDTREKIVLTDSFPENDCMIYRLSLKQDTFTWTSKPRMVCE